MVEDKMPERDPDIEFERQRKRKVMLVSIVLCILCGLFIWQIFSSGAQTAAEGTAGINVTVPDGRVQRTEGDKRKAAERVNTEEQQSRRLLTLGDNGFSLLDDGLKPAVEEASEEDPIRRAADANRKLHTQMQGFYAQPARNAEVEALREQVATLQAQMETQSPQIDPIRLAEEQYKLARSYFGTEGQGTDTESDVSGSERRIFLMRPVREGDVVASTLNPAAEVSGERNTGFLTAAGRKVEEAEAKTIRACIAQTQVISAGSTVRLRLLEPVRIDGMTIPRNKILYGSATIAAMRLQVVVSSIEHDGRIFDVKAVVYDTDGQPGLNVPDSKERKALKEALAAVGQSAGTSVDVNHSAGQAVLSELARGGLQASSRYLSEKLREVKITLKADHRVLLISKEK